MPPSVKKESGISHGTYSFRNYPFSMAKALKRPADHEELAADPQLLDTYAGHYKSPEDIYTVTRDGSRLRLKTDGGLSFEMYPETNGTFFGKTEDLAIRFETDRQGHAATSDPP